MDNLIAQLQEIEDWAKVTKNALLYCNDVQWDANEQLHYVAQQLGKEVAIFDAIVTNYYGGDA